MSLNLFLSPNKQSSIRLLRKIHNTTSKFSSSVDQKIHASNSKQKPRTNEVDIQLLSNDLFKHVFRGSPEGITNAAVVQKCRRELLKHKMVKRNESFIPDVNLKLPPLRGTLIEHFLSIGEEQAKPYRDLVLELLVGVPEMPTKWLLQRGWTRYTVDREPELVDYPLEDCVVFDVEVCVSAGKAPTLATAVSKKAWYGWVSQALVDGTSKPVTSHQYSQDVLVPLESTRFETGVELSAKFLRPKVLVGHNVSYDRARIKEQYWIERTGMRFVDTMSLHICVNGLTSYQRAVLKSGEESVEDEFWKKTSSLNSLSEVYKLYCKAELSKETRDLFVEGSLADVVQEFQNVMNYCAKDVQATYDVLGCLFPLFLERFPHPVTFAGMLEIGTAYLPVNENWERYLDNSDQTYEDLDIEGRLMLAHRADRACQLLHDEKYREDLWMWDQDWEVKHIKLKKSKSKTVATASEEMDELDAKFQYLEETSGYLPKVKTLLPGYPNWYRKLCTKPASTPEWIPGPHLISTGMRVTPKLLGLTWEGYPLHYVAGLGWGLLVPFTDKSPTQTDLPLKKLVEKCPLVTEKPLKSTQIDLKIDKAVEDNLSKTEYYSRVKKDKTGGVYGGSGVWTDTTLEDCCWFLKLPHKDGVSHRVGNPLAKDFLNKFSESVLAGDTESAERVLSISKMLSYWRNNRERVTEQMVSWLEKPDLPSHLRDDGNKYGAIVPQVVVSGTLTRRAVEPTWMTASNAHEERVGSELRAMIQAPPGYNIVGADVDSQELWIASVIGDAASAKIHGGTPFGWMTLSGNKSEGTDMHSVTAQAIGISREHAKVINYARIYGAGQNFAEQLLKQFNPTMSESEARSKATKMFNLTKGKRIFHLRPEYLTDLPDQPYQKWQAYQVAKLHGRMLEDMFYKPKWVGGTESAMFNRLEEIADSPEPITPFLDCRLTRALEPKSMPSDRFLPTRVNWVVQSGAVDFLHLMLVCMRWLMQDRARFCLSFHDEVRYLVPEQYKYETALAMHVTNLLTRSFCVLKLGLNDLPQSVAFFSSVEVDRVLRKDAKHNCKTPSNPHGLDKGYGVPNGDSLDVYDAIEKANGTCKWWNDHYRHVESNKTQACPEGNPRR